MQIYFDNQLAQEVWEEAVGYMEAMPIPYEKLLQGTSIWLGKNPRPHIRSSYRGYYAPARKDIVVTARGFYDNAKHHEQITDAWRADRALKTLLHEIGHHLHFSFLCHHTRAKTEPGLWKPWSEATGYELEFVRGGRHDSVKSYEDFANDVRDWLMGKVGGIERKRFYFSLWGQEVADMRVEMYIDNPEAIIDGETIYIDPDNHEVTPSIVDGRTRLPLRFFYEVLERKKGEEITENPVLDWFPKEGRTEKIIMEI